jgi:outer membrane lipoprotein LolB
VTGGLGKARLTGWLCAATLLLAAGCASPPSAAPVMPSSASEQVSTGPWSGRLSLQVDSEPPQGFHAGFELLGNAQTGELRLYSPLGSALASAQWDAGSALLLRGDERRSYPDIESLTAALTGAALPVATLFEWLQGRAVEPPGWSVELGQADGRVRARRLEPAPTATLRLILDRPQP